MTLASQVKNWLPAAWPAPVNIHAGTTTRVQGYSRPPFAEFNLAVHVGDDRDAVLRNREQLHARLQLPAEPHWLEQTHSNRIVEIHSTQSARNADAAYTDRPGIVCAVLTADCVPVLVCNRRGTEIAIIHAGWRGICAGIINKTLACFKCSNRDLMVWIGPHISAVNYEVRDDVRDGCISALSERVDTAFVKRTNGHWLADLAGMVRITLAHAGIVDIHASNYCTYRDSMYFYSYRRENKTGRMASLIWMTDGQISYA